MAYVLPLTSANQLGSPFAESFYTRSCSSFASHASSATVLRTYPRSVSEVSVRSVSSLPNRCLPTNNENNPPRLAAHSLLNLINRLNRDSPPRRASGHIPQKASWGSSNSTSTAPGSIQQAFYRDEAVEQQRESCIPTPLPIPVLNTSDDIPDEDQLDEWLQTLDEEDDASYIHNEENQVSHQPPAKASEALPFKRWLSTLRRRNHEKRNAAAKHSFGQSALDESKGNQMQSSSPQHTNVQFGHQKSLSNSSSLGFVTAIKSASMTLASTSIAPRSRRGQRSGHLRSDHGSSGFSEVRMSFDSRKSFEPIMDEKAWSRSVQRRKIIEELMESEESYIADMKALVNVYFTLLATAPTLTAQRRKSIQKSVTHIVQLHEELLAELQKFVSNVRQNEDAIPRTSALRSKHTRWRSAESAPLRSNLAITGRRIRHSIDVDRPLTLQHVGLVVNTNTVLNVAKVFDRFMRRFLAYEAYVAHKAIMDQDASSTLMTIPGWLSYERGVEALATSTTSINHREANRRKGLTFSDLLIKPIQRICKYDLFFTELCRQTPACDDPVAHMELQKVSLRLRETADDINRASDNPKTRQLIETSWLLQDRLVFGEQIKLSKTVILRLLGHVLLCGVLHVAYNSNDRVNGQYMVCVLYRSALVLATPTKGFSTYQVVGIISLLNATIEGSDNGRGLQCHTAPYTWKLVFEFNIRHYEMILSACSEKEEDEWKSHLRVRIAAETKDFTEGRSNAAELFSALQLEAKSLGPVFEAHSGFTRRKSIHRAATLGPKTNLHQVIIKNTHAQKLAGESSETSLPVMRSQSHSHLSSTHIPTLAPRRAERIRLEAAMGDVWSRDILPYPGMASRRMESHIRASANSVMRKLSMASIASNFSKRSTSFTSLENHGTDEPRCSSSQWPLQLGPPKLVKRATGLEKIRKRKPVMVDFHNTPNAFLPEDFELKPKQNILETRRRVAKRAATSDGSEQCLTPRQMTPIEVYLDKSEAGRSPLEAYSVCQTPMPVRTPPSIGSNPSSGRSEQTAVQFSASAQENLSPPPFSDHRGPVKTRSLLFKFLHLVKE